jgi:uncharacterized membrane protein
LTISLSKHRIEALADGIFAIVATLIVLELHLPDLPRNASNEAILEGLRHLALPLFGFIITFVLAGAFWTLHQLMMHFVKQVTGPLLLLNLGFLMFVSLLPFSSGFLGRFKLNSSIPVAIYFGNQFLIGALLWLQWQYARRNGLLSAEAETAPKARELSTRVGALALGAGIGVILAFVMPQFAFYGFIIPTLIGRGIIARRSRSADA